MTQIQNYKIFGFVIQRLIIVNLSHQRLITEFLRKKKKKIVYSLSSEEVS